MLMFSEHAGQARAQSPKKKSKGKRSHLANTTTNHNRRIHGPSAPTPALRKESA
jgi:hypothetical protein